MLQTAMGNDIVIYGSDLLYSSTSLSIRRLKV